MEKLWTMTEAAEYLGILQDDVNRLVREGQLSGYQLGGKYLRFRPDQVKALRGRVHSVGADQGAEAPPGEAWPLKVREFVYVYDFYIVSAMLLAGLVVYLIAVG